MVAPLPRREAPLPTPPRRIRAIQWNGLSITALLLGAACLGYGVRQMVFASRAVLLAGVSSSGAEVTPPLEPIPPVSQSIAPPVQAPPAYVPGMAPSEPMPPLWALRQMQSRDVPLPHFVQDEGKLRLQNRHPVPHAVRLQVVKRYNEWRQSHYENANKVEHYMALYTPDAKVFESPGMQISLSQLRALAIAVRNEGTFAKVLDQKPLEWRQNTDGSHVELLAFHCYEDDGGARRWGQRRLVWEKRDGKWLIVRDDFPPSYDEAPLPKPKKPAIK